jgi:putative addiction module component (TIGR02574 family)
MNAMEKDQLDKLHKLSRNEKFEMVHMLWDDLAKEQEEMTIPSDHQRIIDERLAKIKTGKANFKSWDELKLKYRPA